MKYLFAIFLPIFILPLNAQEAGKEKEPVRTCRIIYTNKPVGAAKEAYLFDGEKSHKVILPSLNLSEVIELPLGDITLGLVEQEVVDPELFPKEAPVVKIPSNYKDIYLFLSADPGNEVLPVKIKAVNIEGSKLKIGHTLWVNMSDHNIVAILGDEKQAFPANKMTIAPPPINTNGFYLAQFAFQREGKGVLRPIMKKSWWFDSTSRHIGFIIDTGASMPTIFTIRDRRRPDPAP